MKSQIATAVDDAVVIVVIVVVVVADNQLWLARQGKARSDDKLILKTHQNLSESGKIDKVRVNRKSCCVWTQQQQQPQPLMAALKWERVYGLSGVV